MGSESFDFQKKWINGVTGDQWGQSRLIFKKRGSMGSESFDFQKKEFQDQWGQSRLIFKKRSF